MLPIPVFYLSPAPPNPSLELCTLKRATCRVLPALPFYFPGAFFSFSPSPASFSVQSMRSCQICRSAPFCPCLALLCPPFTVLRFLLPKRWSRCRVISTYSSDYLSLPPAPTNFLDNAALALIISPFRFSKFQFTAPHAVPVERSAAPFHIRRCPKLFHLVSLSLTRSRASFPTELRRHRWGG